MLRCCLCCAGAVLNPAMLAKAGPGSAGRIGAAHTPHAVALMRARLALQSSVQVGLIKAWAPLLCCPGCSTLNGSNLCSHLTNQQGQQVGLPNAAERCTGGCFDE